MSIYTNLYQGYASKTGLSPEDQAKVLADIETVSRQACSAHRSDIEQFSTEQALQEDTVDVMKDYKVGRWTVGNKEVTVQPWNADEMQAHFDELARHYNKSNGVGFGAAGIIFAIAAVALVAVSIVFLQFSLIIAASCFGGAILSTIIAAACGSQKGDSSRAFYEREVKEIANQSVFMAQHIIKKGPEKTLAESAKRVMEEQGVNARKEQVWTAVKGEIEKSKSDMILGKDSAYCKDVPAGQANRFKQMVMHSVADHFIIPLGKKDKNLVCPALDFNAVKTAIAAGS